MRNATSIKVKPKDLKVLIKRAKSRTESKQAIERAKIILACYEGKLVKAIADELMTYPNKIIYWRQRFEHSGIKGLIDKPRSGKPPKDKDLKKKILNKISTAPPKGYGRWDAPLLAEELNCSEYAIWRILRKDGINLQRQRSWCISTDKEFVAKAADIVGLYLEPPRKAIVMCIDEKPSIQALVKEYSKTTEIHVILDNYCTHKKNDLWLNNNPNVHFHYTPTSASWLNMVEIWFGIFSIKSLKGASFRSTDELMEHIEIYIEKYNKNCQPFKWRKREVKGAQLKNNIENLCN